MAKFMVTHDAENNMYISLNDFLYGTKEVAIEKKYSMAIAGGKRG